MEQTLWEQHGDEISAAITLGVAILIALGIDRFLFGRAERAAERLDTATFSRQARTRLRLVRRLVFVAILFIGAALALSQFAEIRRLATGILASTAVIGIVVGFAARQVVANTIAGMLMAVTQPLRIGDKVTVGEHTGRVFDIALTFTSLDAGDGRVIVIPNEMLIADAVVNHSAGDRRAPAIASVWLAPDVDLDAARESLRGIDATSIRVAELTNDGVLLELRAPYPPGTERGARESELREAAQGALRGAGLLGERP